LNAGPTGIGAGRLGKDQYMNFADRKRRIGTAIGGWAELGEVISGTP